MPKKPSLSDVLRRVKALALAAAVLWTVSVTAGSQTALSALSALGQAMPVQILRWELGDLRTGDGLSPAAVLVIGESPLLLSAREAVTELWSSEREERPPSPGQTEDVASTPVEETPLEVTEPAEDNGVPARTLVPSDPSGYTVFGRVYISNATKYDLTPQLLAEPFDSTLPREGPQVLILHTHGSEAYVPAEGASVVWSGDFRTTDSRYNVVRAGDVMASVFDEAGLSVLHDRTLYDYPAYAGAYERSLEAVEKYLAQYPSIRLVLDVHRDAIEDGQGRQYKVVSPIDGVGTAAQMTLVVGSDGGGLDHPHWRENLKLAVAIQEAALTAYPTLMRPLILRNSRYNQHVTTASLLVEVGAAGNSPEEAETAARLLAEQIVTVMKVE